MSNIRVMSGNLRQAFIAPDILKEPKLKRKEVMKDREVRADMHRVFVVVLGPGKHVGT